MRFILAEHIGHHALVYQNRLRRGGRREDQFRTGIGFAARNCRTDALRVVWEAAPGSLIVHHPRQRDAAADDGGKGVNSAGGRAERSIPAAD